MQTNSAFGIRHSAYCKIPLRKKSDFQDCHTILYLLQSFFNLNFHKKFSPDILQFPIGLAKDRIHQLNFDSLCTQCRKLHKIVFVLLPGSFELLLIQTFKWKELIKECSRARCLCRTQRPWPDSTKTSCSRSHFINHQAKGAFYICYTKDFWFGFQNHLVNCYMITVFGV